MLWPLIAILGTLWIVGIATANTFGGLIHILLVVSISLVMLNFAPGPNVE